MAVFLLTNLARVKTAVGVKKGSQDGWLSRLITLVSSDIARHLNRAGAIEQTSRVEIVDVEAEQKRFRMRASPVVSISEIVYEPTQDWANGSVIDAETYVIHSRLGLVELLFDLVPPWGPIQPQSLRITYIGGFATDLPGLRDSDYADVEEAALLQIQAIWKRQKTTPSRVQMTGQGGSVTMDELKLIPEVKRILKPMRRPSVG